MDQSSDACVDSKRVNTSATRSTASARYTTTAIALHWTIAALIIFNLSAGFFMEGPPRHIAVILLHISSGITVLMLTVVRILWRLIHEPPPHPADMKPLERHAAHLVHFALYTAMVLMPLTGWGIISAHPPQGSPGAAYQAAHRPAPSNPSPSGANTPRARTAGAPAKLWFFLPLPVITPIADIGATPGGVEPQKVIHDRFVAWHSTGAYLTLALLILHIAGALKHQIIDKHRELARMGVGSVKIERSASPRAQIDR
jgi:cytochrome b561